MTMTLKLAWRNLLRNRRRTVIAATAMGVGLASLIFCDALILGMEENMIRTATASHLGEGQIHACGYRQSRDAARPIHAPADVLAQLDEDARVQTFAARVMSMGMISSAAGPQALLLIGVHPQAERSISQVDDAIVAGTFFAGQNTQDLVIGERLARLLEADIGDRVVATVAQPRTGALAQELFRVSGVYRCNSRDMDTGMGFVRIDQARRLLDLPDAVHEIALAFRDPAIPLTMEHAFWEEYSTANNEALGWPELVPQLRAVFEYSELSIAIIGLILFGIVALGIVNALFMSIYERLFEFGVLRAVGTRPTAVWRLIVCEAGCLALLGIGFGIGLGALVSLIIAYTGIDYRGIEMVGVVIQDLMFPVITLRQYLFYPFWLFLFTILVGTYPAFFAARIPPAQALRKSL